MKVRILSGNKAGQVVEQDLVEAQSNIAFGFAEPVIDPPAEPRDPPGRRDGRHDDGRLEREDDKDRNDDRERVIDPPDPPDSESRREREPHHAVPKKGGRR